MKILIAKQDAQLNTIELMNFKTVEPMEREELRTFLHESIHFAQVEKSLTTHAGLASAIITDMIQAGVIVIQPEEQSDA